MFSKDQSSTTTTTSAPSTTSNSSNKSNNKNKKVSFQQQQQQQQPQKKLLKDYPLRKSDRRHLRQRVEAVLYGSTSTTTASAAAAGILDAAFLQDTLSSRLISNAPPPYRSVTLYIRSPSSSTFETAPTSDSNNESVSWPYTTSSQCIWITLEESHQKKNAEPIHLPTVALLAALFHHHHHQQKEMMLSSQSFASMLLPLNMPKVIIPSAVSGPLCRGAHVMRAGIMQIIEAQKPQPSESTTDAPAAPAAVPEEQEATAASTGKKNNNNKKNQNNKAAASSADVVLSSSQRLVSMVCIYGNPQPMAVGVLHPELAASTFGSSSSAGLFGPGTKGVGVDIVTCYGDDLWNQQYTEIQQQKQQQQMMTNIQQQNQTSLLDAGHYGNSGFVNGQSVVRIIPRSGGAAAAESDDNSDDGDRAQEENENENENSQNETPERGEEEKTDNDNNERVEKVDDAEKLPETSNDEETANEVESLSPDQVLHEAVCKALSILNAKRDLPMPVNRFYAEFVLPNRPDNTTVQMKQTKYKKFSVYLAEQSEAGLLACGAAPTASSQSSSTAGAAGPPKDMFAVLKDFDKRHPDVRKYVEQQSTTEGNDLSTGGSMGNTNSSNKRLVIVDLYKIPHHFTSLLRLDPDVVKAVNASSEGRKNTGMLTLKEMRAILDDYIVREELMDPKRPMDVRLDGPLTDALFKTKQQQQRPPEVLSRKELAETWQAKMETGYAVVEVPGSAIVKLGRGKPPMVLIEVSKRQNKKFVTRVRGLEEYDISAAAFSKLVSQRFACSSTMVDDSEILAEGRPALKKGHVELAFQGNFVDELEALLLGDESLSSHGGVKGSPYRLPKNSIEVILRKGVPARKKPPGSNKKKK